MKTGILLVTRRAALAACLGLCLYPWPDARAESTPVPGLEGVRRIVFLGDSITQGGDYVVDVECWLLSQGREVEIINLGLGSETATDLTEAENEGHLKKHGFGRPFVSERLARLLAETKPDMVFACYGMNDASSLPSDESGTKRFAEAVTRLREAAMAAGAKEVVMLTPPVRECKDGGWAANTDDQNLGRYSDWLVSMKAKGWSVVDIHGPMRAALDARRAQTPDFGFSKDGVHPGRDGHWVMASCVLTQYFGANLEGIDGAEQVFPANGAEIRGLVQERMKSLFGAWMTRIKHLRPGVPGGPGAMPGPTVDEVTAKAAAITIRIRALQ